MYHTTTPSISWIKKGGKDKSLCKPRIKVRVVNFLYTYVCVLNCTFYVNREIM